MALLSIFLVSLRVGLIRGGNPYYFSFDKGSLTSRSGENWAYSSELWSGRIKVGLRHFVLYNRKDMKMRLLLVALPSRSVSGFSKPN